MAEFSFANSEDKILNSMKISVASISPKMDLIATGSVKGTLALYRYKMVLAWSSDNPKLGAVTEICWRPDGEMLVVAYSSGDLHFCLLEDGYIFHKIYFEDSISHLNWVSNHQTKSQNHQQNDHSEKDMLATSFGWSYAKNFVPEKLSFQNFNNDYLTSEKQDMMEKIMNISGKLDENLNFLVVTSGLCVYIYAQGLYLLIGFDLNLVLSSYSSDKLIQATLSRDFSQLVYFILHYEDEKRAVLRQYKISLSDTLSGMTTEDRETFALHKDILSCKKMLALCMTQIKEAWEDTLLELNTKLTQYAHSRKNHEKNWSLRNELLEYLLFGHCPKQLKQFLIGWTAGGIKKLGMTLAKTYETIQKICYCQIQTILQWMLLFSSELLGIVRADHTRPLGIFEKRVEQMVRDIGAAFQKTQEVQLVIDKVTQHLKTFFLWLYESILDLSGSENKSNYTLSQSDQELIVDFISNQLIPTVVDGQIEGYHIELVEQYIMKGDLKKSFQVEFDHNLLSYLSFIFSEYDPEDMPDSFYLAYANSSLVDVIEDKLFQDISNTFDNNWGIFTMTFVELIDLQPNDILIMEDCTPSDDLIISNFCLMTCTYIGSSTKYTALASQTRDSIYLFLERDDQETMERVEITLDRLPGDEALDGKYEIDDMKFFTESESGDTDSLTLLVTRVDTASPISLLVFTPLHHLTPLFGSDTCTPISKLVTDTAVETLPRRALRLEINSDRNLAFIVFENQQQCRTYILEPLDNEEVDDENNE